MATRKNAIIGSVVAVGICGAAAYVLHARHNAVSQITANLEGPSPLCIVGATATHGPISLRSSGLTVQSILLRKRDGSTAEIGSLDIDKSGKVVATDIVMEMSGGIRMTLKNASMKIPPNVRECGGSMRDVVASSIIVSADGKPGSVRVADLSIDELGVNGFKNLLAKKAHFDNFQRGDVQIGADVDNIHVDNFMRDTQDPSAGLRHIEINGVKTFSGATKTGTIEAITYAASMDGNNVTGLHFHITNAKSDPNALLADIKPTPANLAVNIIRYDDGIMGTLTSEGGLLPSILGEVRLKMQPPPSLLTPMKDWPHSPEDSFESAQLSLKDKLGGFTKIVDAGLRLQQTKREAIDPAVRSSLKSVPFLNPNSIEDIADWIQNPAQTITLEITPSKSSPPIKVVTTLTK